jgi:hypothetical protein
LNREKSVYVKINHQNNLLAHPIYVMVRNVAMPNVKSKMTKQSVYAMTHSKSHFLVNLTVSAQKISTVDLVKFAHACLVELRLSARLAVNENVVPMHCV